MKATLPVIFHLLVFCFISPSQAMVTLENVPQEIIGLDNIDPNAKPDVARTVRADIWAGAVPTPGKYFEFSIVPGHGGYPGANLSFGEPVDFSQHEILGVWFKTSAPLGDFQIVLNGADGVIVDHLLSPSAAAPAALVPANTWRRAYISYKDALGWVRFGEKMDFSRIKSLSFYSWDGALSKKESRYTFQIGGLALLGMDEARQEFRHTMYPTPIQTAAVLYHNKDFQVWTTAPGEKILRDTPLPAQAAVKQAAQTTVAGNEFASLTWIVTPTHSLTNVQGHTTGLTNGNKSIMPSQITLRYVDYVASPYFDAPDPLPLLPLSNSDNKSNYDNSKNVEVAGGQNLQIWATVEVPDGTPPGIYNGHVQLKAEANGKPVTIELPLRIRVRSFSLPRTRHLKSLIHLEHPYSSPPELIKQDAKRYWGKDIEPFGADYKTVMNGIFRDFARIRMSPILQRSWLSYPSIEEKVRLHEQYGFDPMFYLSYNLARDYSKINPGESSEREQLRQKLKNQAQELERFAEKGLVTAKIFDEPDAAFLPKVVLAAEDLQAVAPWADRFVTLTTPHIPQELIGKVNAWCMQWNFDFDSPEVRQRLAAGDSIWVYGAEYKFNYAYLPMDIRAPYWLYWKWKITGVHHAHHMHPAFLTYPNDTYPHSNGLRPIPSIRWEMIGHGAQDFEYLWMLNDLIQQAGTQGEKFKPLLDIPENLAHNQIHYSHNPQSIEKQREKIADAIEELQKILSSRR